MKKTDGPPEILTATKLIVRVLQDVVQRERFATYGDLAEALRTRCAKLKIRYDGGLISAAIDRLELGGKARLIVPGLESGRGIGTPSHAPVEFTRADALKVYLALMARYQSEHPIAVIAPANDGRPEHFPDLTEIE